MTVDDLGLKNSPALFPSSQPSPSYMEEARLRSGNEDKNPEDYDKVQVSLLRSQLQFIISKIFKIRVLNCIHIYFTVSYRKRQPSRTLESTRTVIYQLEFLLLRLNLACRCITIQE